ncbi:hypothetical protein NE237_015510 [Protea cynaroides]|uniref:Glycosyltransferase n=1 Tax=Protea cynaroides TaxID=273540 RepID=A0A9Q0KE72_9MAGN|nr:hypothetical protein NE237_015510 [Protea cynaroides]
MDLHDEKHAHFLLVSYPSQGHLNPTLQLAKRLISTTGTNVTLATTVYGQSLLTNKSTNTLPLIPGLSFAFFTNGFDERTNPSDDLNHIAAQMKLVGSQSFSDLVNSFNKDHPVTFIIYTILLPWVADVARILHIPSAFLWISCATVFAIYYLHFNGHDPLIETPGLSPLTLWDLPSFFQPSSPHTFVLPILHEHLQALQQDHYPRVLVNSCDALEGEALRAPMAKLKIIGIGPLTPSMDTDDNEYGCDLFENTSRLDYIEWLNSKKAGSVVYVSFGSLVVLPKRQIEEIFHGLVESQRPFLWVLRSSDLELKEEGQGMIVTWCSQVEVLNHPSVGCFVTHCGWNSTLESLVIGVPVVGCPHFSDQPTNAKMIETVFETGVRAKVSEEEEGIVERGEIKRCLDMVMEGKSGEEMRRNALKWRDLVMVAVAKDGSSTRNFLAFVEEVARGCNPSTE